MVAAATVAVVLVVALVVVVVVVEVVVIQFSSFLLALYSQSQHQEIRQLHKMKIYKRKYVEKKTDEHVTPRSK